jgi:hypothetical protein
MKGKEWKSKGLMDAWKGQHTLGLMACFEELIMTNNIKKASDTLSGVDERFWWLALTYSIFLLHVVKMKLSLSHLSDVEFQVSGFRNGDKDVFGIIPLVDDTPHYGWIVDMIAMDMTMMVFVLVCLSAQCRLDHIHEAYCTAVKRFFLSCLLFLTWTILCNFNIL